MTFEWDPDKNAANIAKHGVSFATAARIFEGPVLTAPDTRHDYGEQRANSIGVVDGVLYLVVTHTDRDGRTRIISARPAKRAERQRYDETI
jgi:uncharacterized DUF497 family protein